VVPDQGRRKIRDVKYEAIADRKLVPMSTRERAFLNAMLDKPSADYKALVVALADGCEFPRQQAALMLLNTPSAAHKIIIDHAKMSLLEELGVVRLTGLLSRWIDRWPKWARRLLASDRC
jgi:hypothetical protein